MEQSIFNNSEGLAVYQVISFFIFLFIFIGVTIWIFTLDKGVIRKMEEIPLDSEPGDEILIDNPTGHEGEKYEVK